MRIDRFVWTAALLFGVSMCSACNNAKNTSALASSDNGKIPVTTKSEEARKEFLLGRGLAEKLLAQDSLQHFDKAIALDPEFASAELARANASGVAKDFFDHQKKAVSLADKVSEPERLLILASEAAANGDVTKQKDYLDKLAAACPNDERAHLNLGNYYFGQQEYGPAIEHYRKATEIAPSYSPAYNILGYALRQQDNFSEAEQAFKKYIELIPNDPNPHDSYAELLMKMGRFDESIKAYEKALSLDPNFVASYVGIGNDHLFAGRPDQARAAFARIAAIARNNGEKRLSHFWTAAAYVHEGATDKALEEIRAEYAIAETEHDAASMSGDLTQMGDVLREAARLDDAAAKYDEAVTVISKGDVPKEVKDATLRNHVFEQGRPAVSRNAPQAAKSKAAEYASLIAPRKVPFEARQAHELTGLIALAEKRALAAVQEFASGNQQDPRILYLTAIALREAGDARKASAMAAKAAKFNGLSFNYAYVKSKAAKVTTTTSQ